MRFAKLNEMVKGWFVGNFNPTLYRTSDVEVAVKRYCAGDHEGMHYHKIATEITVVVFGTVRLNGKEYSTDDIIVMEPNEATNFYAVTDAVTAVVKLPGANNDKYPVEESK